VHVAKAGCCCSDDGCRLAGWTLAVEAKHGGIRYPQEDSGWMVLLLLPSAVVGGRGGYGNSPAVDVLQLGGCKQNPQQP